MIKIYSGGSFIQCMYYKTPASNPSYADERNAAIIASISVSLAAMDPPPNTPPPTPPPAHFAYSF